MSEPYPVGAAASPKRAVLVVNAKSRTGWETFHDAQRRLAQLGVELTTARAFSRIEEAQRFTKDAIAAGAPLVIAGGGDGTFSAIARYFVGSDSVLGVLPLGTGNAFARDLEIPPDLEKACQTIASGRPASVDLGYVNGDYFLNVASIGLTTRIALALTNPMKRRFGRFVYMIALIQALARVQPFHVHLEADGVVSEFETLLVVVGNGRYHAGPFLLSQNASIVDGRLSLYALATTRKSAFLKFALALVTGRQGDLPEVRSESPISGVITTDPVKRVTVDGEVNIRTPLEFAVAPRALRVLVPQEFDG